MQNKEFKLRREELLKQIGANSIAIIFANKECCHLYRQNSDLYYLTGFAEPEAIAVLIPDRKQGGFILFNRKRDVVKELWDGVCVGQEKACSEFGADQAFPTEELDEILPQLLLDRERVYFNIGYDFDLKSKLKASHELISIDKILHEMRLRKRPYELELMRRAVEITAAGHLRAMQKCCSGMQEYELEAEIIYEFMRLGGCREAFKTMVGGGANACTLHYSKNNDTLVDGDLVLIDAGVEYNHYCADVSRTFPVNGRFTKEQQAIYEVVLMTQLEIINQIRPGVRFDSLQLFAEKIITECLMNLGLLKKNQSCKSFFMHKIGHWIGLEAHDVGGYCINGEWRVLESGMVLTVEPGVYIASNAPVDNKWHNIGIRIEDEILVTENSCEILTKVIPKTIEELNYVKK